jgi:hypothetical protein
MWMEESMKKNLFRSFVCFALCALMLAAVNGFAQTTGTITGTVTDTSGAVIPGVEITVTNTGTDQSRSTLTNETGHYYAPALNPGGYKVSASLPGFDMMVRSGVTLTVGGEAVINFSLKPGQVSETIDVTGEAPLLNTTPSSTAGLINEEQVKDLPLNGRSWDSLVTLNPSTTNFTSNQSTTSTGKGQGFNFSVSGNREDFNLFLMNGIEYTGVSTADVMPGGVSGYLLGVDAVKEFNVQQNSYGAEYGKRPGGQVTVVTTSGTNQWHGDVFEFLRNSALDARNFFAQGINPPFKRNQFGGALGGPIKKDRTFIFGNYEGFRQSLSQSSVAFVPDASTRDGSLLGSNGKPIGLAPGIAPYFALWPQPNGPDLGSGVAVSYNNPAQTVREDFGNLRIDHNFSSNDMFSGIYTVDDGQSSTPGSNPLTRTLSILRAQVLSLQQTHLFSPSVLNITRFGFSRAHWNLVANPPVTPPGTSFVPGQPVGLISIGSASFNSIGAVSPAGSSGSQQFEIVARNLFTYTDDLQITRGKHLISAGAWVQRIQANDDAANQRNGVATFASLTSFMQGQASSIVGVLNPAEIGWRQFAGAWYVQDTLKARSSVTLNLGFRHEFNNGWNSPSSRASNFVFGTTGCSAGVAQCLQTQPVLGTSPYTVNNAKWLFGPRVALAWTPLSKTAVHVAFGTYYSQLDYLGSCCDGSPIGNNLNINPSIGSKTAPATFPVQLSPNLPGAKVSPAGVQTDLKTPTVEEWNLKIEQEITANTLFSVAYVGSHGYHLPNTLDMNTVAPTPTADGSIAHPFPSTVVRANNAIANTRYTLSNANSSYNALQLTLNRRLSQGLQFRGNYTFSKSLDIHSSSFLGNEGLGGTTTVMNPYNPRADWGPSNFNPAQQFSGNFSYDLPVGHGRSLAANASNLADKIIGGWTWHGIITSQTGFPFTPLVGSNQSNNGDSRNPDRVSINPNFTGPVIVGKATQWYDPAAFLLPPAGTYGNAGRNILTGPGLTEVDMSLFKNTAITEAIKAQFRVECFNLLNHANLGMPVVSMFSSGQVSPTAGAITYTTTTQREIQFGLKLLW